MDNKMIIKVALSIAIFGIIGMYLFTNLTQNAISIAEATNFVGEKVTVKGTIDSYYTSKDGHVFFSLSDMSGSIKAVVFRNSNIESAYNLKDGQKIVLTGKVEEYKDSFEIIASKIDF